MLRRKCYVQLQGDNTGMIKAIEKGSSAALRHVGRTHRVSLAWLHERVADKDLMLAYSESNAMRADVLTKGFSNAASWTVARMNVNVGTMLDFFPEHDELGN